MLTSLLLKKGKYFFWASGLTVCLSACDVDKALRESSNNTDRSSASKQVASDEKLEQTRKAAPTKVQRNARKIVTAKAPVEPEPQPKPAKAKADSDGTVKLKWEVPTERKNGEALAIDDIQGYEIYFTNENGDTRTIRVDDAKKTSVMVKDLKPDTYHFAMAVIDKDGEFSELSNTIPKTVD